MANFGRSTWIVIIKTKSILMILRYVSHSSVKVGIIILIYVIQWLVRDTLEQIDVT